MFVPNFDPRNRKIIDFSLVFQCFLRKQPVEVESEVESVMAASWRRLGASWRVVGVYWARLGGVLARLGRVLSASWARLSASWARLGASWKRLGGVLEASWRVLGASGPIGYPRLNIGHRKIKKVSIFDRGLIDFCSQLRLPKPKKSLIFISFSMFFEKTTFRS